MCQVHKINYLYMWYSLLIDQPSYVHGTLHMHPCEASQLRYYYCCGVGEGRWKSSETRWMLLGRCLGAYLHDDLMNKKGDLEFNVKNVKVYVILQICLVSRIWCMYAVALMQNYMDFCFTGIKKYIVGLIIRTSSDASTLEREKVYLGKLNMILVQVTTIVS